MRRKRRKSFGEVAVYKGDDIIATGTIDECAAQLKVAPRTIKFYASPVYQRRLASIKKQFSNAKITVRI